MTRPNNFNEAMNRLNAEADFVDLIDLQVIASYVQKLEKRLSNYETMIITANDVDTITD